MIPYNRNIIIQYRLDHLFRDEVSDRWLSLFIGDGSFLGEKLTTSYSVFSMYSTFSNFYEKWKLFFPLTFRPALIPFNIEMKTQTTTIAIPITSASLIYCWS